MSAVSGALLALLLHPSVQTRAQAELDEVVGRDRLPEFSDRASLPFIEAICREVLRWKVIVPMAIPHASTEDDMYKGYFIPKGAAPSFVFWALNLFSDPTGTIVAGNAW